ncbi:nicotinate-nucleotide pyrophosphorylase [carboxylating] [Algoriphagus alkaliphilus]|uniref:Probable nicotinate-nucleotide pyrophosphorylase [carboxylating] n=1 Tax=Algoriphagus alkaliphilus TaxID=279824 RepID=A0A1G5ZQU2_9BACT|nr:carboxylating nicotinate-nucleotide diphosphorylase [Algoriphagus alkaliphilus]MBA4300978.1 nicotinate-nucleotide diphosphorylase (carboxylating) [Cyclobacterium sp.]SDA96846.1 nicotinate-nucleotide pyrophosphorylase [carboxylating] [Algoriphagus alkaliphilus]
MKPAYLTTESIQKFIQSALLEDIGPGDYSSLASIPAGKTGKAKLLIKDDGILAGVELAEEIFKAVDPRLEVEFFKKDGDPVKVGDIGLTVSGPSASILSAERLVLNCMQRMSAIATKTHRLSQLISHTKAKLMDTRKTTPNFRLMEKWAVLIGGGVNHRFALYDMVMLKDNHVDFAGGIRSAIERTRSYLSDHSLNLKIEIETRNLDEVRQVLEVGGVDYIMLDNMDYDTMREAVRMIDGKYSTEASGGITEETLAKVAECGVDYISMGALTHSVSSLDISLKAI